MTRRPRRNRSPAFRAKVALAAIKGERALAGLAQQFDVPPDQITQWPPSSWKVPLASSGLPPPPGRLRRWM